MTAAAITIPGYVAGRWTIDPVHTYVGFVIKHMMVSKVRGQFSRFSGEIVTAEDPLNSSVSAQVEVSSIDTHNEMRDNHIRSADFFDAEHHPVMSFRSTGVRYSRGEFALDGELTIRGTTRAVSFRLDPPEFGPSPQGGRKGGFSAATEINRQDFGVSYNGPIPGGGMALGDTVQVVLEVEADLIGQTATDSPTGSATR